MQQNQQHIPRALAVFLGESGMGHPDEVGPPPYSLSPPAAIMCALTSREVSREYSFSEQ